MIRFTNTLFIATLCFGSIACTSEQEDPVVTPVPVVEEPATFEPSFFTVKSLSVQDMGNNHDLSDIMIRFSAPGKSTEVTHYELAFTDAAQRSTLDSAQFTELDTTKKLVLSNDRSNYSLHLANSLLDADGQTFDPSKSYLFHVISVGNSEGRPFSVVHSSTEPFKVTDELLVLTMVSDFEANDGLFIDNEGNLIASDYGVYSNATNLGTGTKVISVKKDGSIATLTDQVIAPMKGAQDSNGNYYFSHDCHGLENTGKVVRVDKDGNHETLAEITGWPAGIVVDENNNAYVTNFTVGVITKISSSGVVSTLATNNALAGAVGIVQDKDGNLITSNYSTGAVHKVDVNTGVVSEITQVSGVLQGSALGYLTILNDTLYATGIGNHKIYRITMDGSVMEFAGTGFEGSSDGGLSSAQFSQPNGIVADPSTNRLYISQFGQRALRYIQL